MSVTSANEAYFLVRVGSWSEDDLERWVQKRISDKVDEVSEEYYERVLAWEARDRNRYSREESSMWSRGDL